MAKQSEAEGKKSYFTWEICTMKDVDVELTT